MRRMGSSWAEAWGLFFYCEGGTHRDGRADGVRAGTGRKRMSAQGWKTKRRG